MKSIWIDLKNVAKILQEKCPFIKFALISGPDENGCLNVSAKLDLSVFVGSGIGTWVAIEKILPVITVAVPEVCCEVTLLNLADPATRYRAMQDICLFIQTGQEHVFHEFDLRSKLDYRIMRAQKRRRGLVEDD